LLRRRHRGGVLLRFAGHLPGGDHVLGGLQRQRLAGLLSLGPHGVGEQLFLVLLFLLGRLVFVDDRLRRQRVLVVRAVEEHAGQRVVIALRNRVVLVIVAA